MSNHHRSVEQTWLEPGEVEIAMQRARRLRAQYAHQVFANLITAIRRFMCHVFALLRRTTSEPTSAVHPR